MAFKVLLVEDDNNLREIYEARLQAEGYEIVTARDGEEALGVAKAETPDLVISDVMMPRVSGFEMLDILRNTEALKDVRVIMLTALGQADDKTRADSLGADRYLVKSQVTLEDIVKTAHELLGDTAAEPATAAVPAPSTPPATPIAPSPTVPPTPAVAVAPAPPAVVTPVTPAPVASPSPAPTVVPAPPIPTPMPTTIPPTVSPVARPVQAPVAPAPVPTPPVAPSFPGAVPAAAPIPTPMPTTIPPTPAAPTTSEEQATIDSQINNFVRTAPDTTPVAEPGSSATQDDAVLADAMHDLAASTAPDDKATEVPIVESPTSPMPVAPVSPVVPTPNPAGVAMPMSPQPAIAPIPAPAASPSLSIPPRPMTTPTTPEAPVKPDDKPAITGSVLIANKKIIQPLSGAESKPNIHELAAREEADSAAAAAFVPGTMPTMTFSPNAMPSQVPPAGPVVSEPAVTPPAAPQPPQAPPAAPNGFDPNSISL